MAIPDLQGIISMMQDIMDSWTQGLWAPMSFLEIQYAELLLSWLIIRDLRRSFLHQKSMHSIWSL